MKLKILAVDDVLLLDVHPLNVPDILRMAKAAGVTIMVDRTPALALDRVLMFTNELREMSRAISNLHIPRIEDFKKDWKKQRAQALTSVERVQLQRLEKHIKPHNPRVTGADIRRFIPRRV